MAPVNVIAGAEAFWHTDVVPLIVAVGKGLTVMVTFPVWVWLHVVLLPSLTLTSA